jgi:AbrB family looped-hinge helix DNA binding protein
MKQVTIDKLGRLVLPKPVRDELGLAPGDRIDLVRTRDGVELRPVDRRESSVVRRGRVLVLHVPAATPAVDPARLLGQQREDRMKRLRGQ